MDETIITVTRQQILNPVPKAWERLLQGYARYKEHLHSREELLHGFTHPPIKRLQPIDWVARSPLKFTDEHLSAVIKAADKVIATAVEDGKANGSAVLCKHLDCGIDQPNGNDCPYALLPQDCLTQAYMVRTVFSAAQDVRESARA